MIGGIKGVGKKTLSEYMHKKYNFDRYYFKKSYHSRLVSRDTNNHLQYVNNYGNQDLIKRMFILNKCLLEKNIVIDNVSTREQYNSLASYIKDKSVVIPIHLCRPSERHVTLDTVDDFSLLLNSMAYRNSGTKQELYTFFDNLYSRLISYLSNKGKITVF